MFVVCVLVAVFLALLQTFWESWGLSELPVWTFPAMLLMLGTPVLLHLIAHVLFPSENDNIGFTEYYFSKSRLVFSLASVTVLVSVLFKPIAFDMPLFIIDNLSSLFSFIICALLAISKNKWLHRILVPVGTVIIILDTLAISYQIH